MAEYFKLFWSFFKLGLFTIGGGLAMIPQMQQVAVKDNHWMTDEEVVDCIAVSQSLPGVIAINMATYIGRKLRGFPGAVTACIAVCLPSFIIITLAVLVLGAIEGNPWVTGAVRLGKQILRTPFQWILMIAAFAAIGVFGINAVWVILAAALIGIVWSAAHRSPEDPESRSKEVR